MQGHAAPPPPPPPPAAAAAASPDAAATIFDGADGADDALPLVRLSLSALATAEEGSAGDLVELRLCAETDDLAVRSAPAQLQP